MKTVIILLCLTAIALALPQRRFQFPSRSSAPVPKRILIENAHASPFKKEDVAPVKEVDEEEPIEEDVDEEIPEEEEEDETEEEEQVEYRPIPNFRRMPVHLKPEPVATPVKVRTPMKKANAVKNYVPNEYEIQQNQAAKYEFQSNVEDNISDLTQQRSEVRDGLAVKGMYSYSDGYFKRTVHYEADEKGYRIVSMESEPLDGPHVDLNGDAHVSNDAHGSQINYRVQSIPVEGPKAKIVN